MKNCANNFKLFFAPGYDGKKFVYVICVKQKRYEKFGEEIIL